MHFDPSVRHPFAPPHPVTASRRRYLPLLGARRGLIVRNGPAAKSVRSIKLPVTKLSIVDLSIIDYQTFSRMLLDQPVEPEHKDVVGEGRLLEKRSWNRHHRLPIEPSINRFPLSYPIEPWTLTSKSSKKATAGGLPKCQIFLVSWSTVQRGTTLLFMQKHLPYVFWRSA